MPGSPKSPWMYGSPQIPPICPPNTWVLQVFPGCLGPPSSPSSSSSPSRHLDSPKSPLDAWVPQVPLGLPKAPPNTGSPPRPCQLPSPFTCSAVAGEGGRDFPEPNVGRCDSPRPKPRGYGDGEGSRAGSTAGRRRQRRVPRDGQRAGSDGSSYGYRQKGRGPVAVARRSGMRFLAPVGPAGPVPVAPRAPWRVGGVCEACERRARGVWDGPGVGDGGAGMWGGRWE